MLEDCRLQRTVTDPDELINDMGNFLQDVGHTSSFIDPDQEQARKDNLWQLLTRGLTNDLSFQNKMFKQNLEPKKAET